MGKSDIPFGSEFSPTQIDLPTLLDFVASSQNDWRKFESYVYEKYFKTHKTSEYNRRKLANNTKLSMISYGLINRDASFTSVGHALYAVRNNSAVLYSNLARHILLNLHGVLVLQCIQDMQVAGHVVTLIDLRKWLEERGINFPRGGKHPSILRLWLEKVSIFNKNSWHIDEQRLAEVLGSDLREVDVLSSLTAQQRAFLRTLANLGESGPFGSSELEKLAIATYGVNFDEKNLPKSVLYPLQSAGFIEITRGTKQVGRGAKPFFVVPTEKLQTQLVIPLMEQLDKQVGGDIRPLLRKPLADILKELDSTNKHVRGLALEALAFKLMRLIDLSYVATRLRGIDTGGAEVDLIFESARLIFSRWQVQCKNVAAGVGLDDVAKEVGLTLALKSNVIAIVSTGKISAQARQYASKVMKDSNLNIALLDRGDLEKIKNSPYEIVAVLNREAKTAMKLKALGAK